MITVLLLEEEPSVMKLLRHMLTQYNLIEAHTAEEALLLFIDLDCQVDLLIADLTTPKRSGIQVALLLRSKLPSLPVILTSRNPVSHWSAQRLADLNRLGSRWVAIVQKPFAADDLLNAVRELTGTAPSPVETRAPPSMLGWP
jgi:DNA-binding response OmpR family regulator